MASWRSQPPASASRSSRSELGRRCCFRSRHRDRHLPRAAMSDQPQGAPRRSLASSTVMAAGGLALLLGLALRIRGAEGDLWLDEIWSLRLVGLLRPGRFLIASLAVDNNHYLNTLFLLLAGPDAPVLVLRSFSILLGLAAIPVAGYALRRAGPSGVIA